jgi:hypothetical protein
MADKKTRTIEARGFRVRRRARAADVWFQRYHPKRAAPGVKLVRSSQA